MNSEDLNVAQRRHPFYFALLLCIARRTSLSNATRHMSHDFEKRAAEQFEKHDGLQVLFFFDPEEEERKATQGWDQGEIHCIEAGADLFSLKYRLEREL